MRNRDGKPSSFDSGTIQIGALDSYEVRCRACYEPDPLLAVKRG